MTEKWNVCTQSYMTDRWNEGGVFFRRKTIDYLDCDTEKKLFLHAAMGEFSEIAGDEVQSKGHSHAYLYERGQVFLITRMSMRFHRIPKAHETIVYSTWFRKTEGRVFLRDCEVHSDEGELLASGSGTWMLYGINEGAVISPDKLTCQGSTAVNKKSDAPECKKVVPEGEPAVLGYRPVYYTDLDCNSHINNAAYNRIAVDFLPSEYRQKNIADYVINFNRETRLGETLELRGCEITNGYIIQGYVDGVLHFGSEFVFST